MLRSFILSRGCNTSLCWIQWRLHFERDTHPLHQMTKKWSIQTCVWRQFILIFNGYGKALGLTDLGATLSRKKKRDFYYWKSIEEDLGKRRKGEGRFESSSGALHNCNCLMQISALYLYLWSLTLSWCVSSNWATGPNWSLLGPLLAFCSFYS